MTFQLGTVNLQNKKINFDKLKPDYFPGYQKEIESYKKAIILKGKDSMTGREIKDKETRTWPRDMQPGELAYYSWLARSTDDNMNWNNSRDEQGNRVKGTGAKKIVDQIVRVRTVEGEFLVSVGRLEGYDAMGNKTHKSCNSPEKWTETLFNFENMYDPNTGQTIRQCTGPSGSKVHYDMPFNKENLRELVKQRAGDNIPFSLKDETTAENPKGIPNTGSIESRINLFMKPFDYLFKAEYISKEEIAINRRMSELILSGKASNEEQAAEIAAEEIETGNKTVTRKDIKTGVA